jgi:hypothetical protein
VLVPSKDGTCRSLRHGHSRIRFSPRDGMRRFRRSSAGRKTDFAQRDVRRHPFCRIRPHSAGPNSGTAGAFLDATIAHWIIENKRYGNHRSGTEESKVSLRCHDTPAPAFRMVPTMSRCPSGVLERLSALWWFFAKLIRALKALSVALQLLLNGCAIVVTAASPRSSPSGPPPADAVAHHARAPPDTHFLAHRSRCLAWAGVVSPRATPYGKQTITPAGFPSR